MKRALITGITGQVGSHMADLLLSKGYEVHGIVRRISSSHLGNIEHLRGKVQLHYADLCDQASLYTAFAAAKPDEVYNFAAQSFVAASWAQAEYTGNATGLGVTRIIEALRNVCPGARFYQASSSEIFGKARETPQRETTPLYPRSPYGAAKAYGHWLTVNARESYGLFAVSGICFNAEGERRGPEFITRKVSMGAARIRKELDRGLAPEPLLLGNLDAQRDWGYAGDYVHAMHAMLQVEQPEDYVIATGRAHSIRDLCQLAFQFVDLDWNEFVQVDEKFLRPAEVDTLVGNTSKIQRQLGWKASVNFEELVCRMVAHDLALRQG